MGAASAVSRADATAIGRTIDRTEEQAFGSVLSDIARMLWPNKTAANVAALVGCTERAAEFWLSGQREWSGDALAAIVGEICIRHKMRNIKVRAR